MTQEEKAIRILASSCIPGSKQTEALETLIPELSESEDERTRKAIISALKFANDDGVYDKHIAYLEKQKGKMTAEEFESSELFQLKLKTKYANGYQDGLAQKEQKPAEWSEEDIARKELNAYTKGYNKGYKDAEKQYNESVAYHFPIMPTPPSGWGCDGKHCTNPHHDCINCPLQYSSGGTITTPNTASGTSTATLHGNTSATDGKEHK